MNSTRYWIWLQCRLGYGCINDEIIASFKDAEEIYRLTNGERRVTGAFTPRQLGKLKDDDLSEADKIIESCEKIGCKIITPDMDEYPKSLLQIRDIPIVLYALGDVSLLKEKTISLVGTRKASVDGLYTAYKLASSLSRAGITVVSGGACGIDGASHMGAFSETGKTVAVLGCGFNSKYKDAAKFLRNQFLERGLLVSEFPPDVEARGSFFPTRNRIISALSYGTVVVEGEERSGSLITARLALEQGKDLFAVPGGVLNTQHTGTVKLIRDGAIPVFACSDVLSIYELLYPDFTDWDKMDRDLLFNIDKEVDFSGIIYRGYNIEDTRRTASVKPLISSEAKASPNPAENIADEKPDEETLQKAVNSLSENAATVYRVLSDEPVNADEITKKCELPVHKVLGALTELELSGIINCHPGKKYSLK